MKRKKPKIELRYYYMPAGSPILPLLGERWVQNYGTGIEDLHFHNFMEIGFCYYGEGILTLGEEKRKFQNGLTGNCYGIASSVAAIAKELRYEP